MKPKYWHALVAKYQAAIGAYVARDEEQHLERAYELGRTALNLGLGVIDLARLHQEAVTKLTASLPHAPGGSQWMKALDAFLMEALSAFEVAHRGFRDACDRLQRLNETLEQRNRDLAASNRQLAQEIQERKNAQDSLAESELKFRSVIETAQDGIITIDERGRLVAMNRSAELMFGYRGEELIRTRVQRLIPKPLRAAAELTLKCLANGGEHQLLEHPVESVGLRRDGTELPLELTLATWRTRAGLFFTGVVRDIRQRKQAEMELRESRQHYIKLFEEARTMEENLRLLSNRVITAQEEERKHISRELHDEIGQALTAANVSIALLRQHAAADETFRKKVDRAQRLLEQSMDMVHRFARELRPSMLDHLGPYAALQNYVKLFTERTGIKAELESTVSLEALNQQQGTVLYRVAQESLTNVFKHAHATRVKIRLRQLPRAVCMEIIDNGRAFQAPKQLNGAGSQRLGLLGMQERVRLVNGEFAIESVPKRGTTVRVQIPLPARSSANGTIPRNGSAPGRRAPAAVTSASN
ncbi:MAG: PAS domain S-box protein [Opitutaceae bacterium]|nr:PAS domain S-box protein [Opitutaceae bacterium]